MAPVTVASRPHRCVLTSCELLWVYWPPARHDLVHVCHPQKCPSGETIPAHVLHTVTRAPQIPAQTPSRSFHSFLQGSRPWPTDAQTHNCADRRPRYFDCSNRPHSRSMRAMLTNSYWARENQTQHEHVSMSNYWKHSQCDCVALLSSLGQDSNSTIRREPLAHWCNKIIIFSAQYTKRESTTQLYGTSRYVLATYSNQSNKRAPIMYIWQGQPKRWSQSGRGMNGYQPTTNKINNSNEKTRRASELTGMT